MVPTKRNSNKKLNKQDSLSSFWNNEVSVEKIPASRLKIISKCEKAECIALTVWERITKDNFNQIQFLDSTLIKYGEIVAKDMKDSLKQIFEMSGIDERTLKAVHPSPLEAVLRVLQQILHLFNQPVSELSEEVLVLSQKKHSVPHRITQVIHQAKKLGINELSEPSITYANDRARLAMFERQVKGKMKLLHEKFNKNKLYASFDKSCSDVKTRIRKVIALREKIKAELSQESETQEAFQREIKTKPHPSKIRIVKETPSDTPIFSIGPDQSITSKQESATSSSDSLDENTDSEIEIVETIMSKKIRESLEDLKEEIKEEEIHNIFNINIAQNHTDNFLHSAKIDTTQNEDLSPTIDCFNIIKNDTPVEAEESFIFSNIKMEEIVNRKVVGLDEEISINTPYIFEDSTFPRCEEFISPSKSNLIHAESLNLHKDECIEKLIDHVEKTDKNMENDEFLEKIKKENINFETLPTILQDSIDLNQANLKNQDISKLEKNEPINNFNIDKIDENIENQVKDILLKSEEFIENINEEHAESMDIKNPPTILEDSINLNKTNFKNQDVSNCEDNETNKNSKIDKIIENMESKVNVDNSSKREEFIEKINDKINKTEFLDNTENMNIVPKLLQDSLDADLNEEILKNQFSSEKLQELIKEEENTTKNVKIEHSEEKVQETNKNNEKTEYLVIENVLQDNLNLKNQDICKLEKKEPINNFNINKIDENIENQVNDILLKSEEYIEKINEEYAESMDIKNPPTILQDSINLNNTNFKNQDVSNCEDNETNKNSKMDKIIDKIIESKVNVDNSSKREEFIKKINDKINKNQDNTENMNIAPKLLQNSLDVDLNEKILKNQFSSEELQELIKEEENTTKNVKIEYSEEKVQETNKNNEKTEYLVIENVLQDNLNLENQDISKLINNEIKNAYVEKIDKNNENMKSNTESLSNDEKFHEITNYEEKIQNQEIIEIPLNILPDSLNEENIKIQFSTEGFQESISEENRHKNMEEVMKERNKNKKNVDIISNVESFQEQTNTDDIIQKQHKSSDSLAKNNDNCKDINKEESLQNLFENDKYLSVSYSINYLLNQVFDDIEKKSIDSKDYSQIKTQDEIITDQIVNICQNKRIRKVFLPFELNCFGSSAQNEILEEDIAEFVSATEVDENTSCTNIDFVHNEQVEVPSASLEKYSSQISAENDPVESCATSTGSSELTMQKWMVKKNKLYGLFVLSAFIGVGALGYFTNTGQEIISNIIQAKSYEKANSIFDYLPFFKS